MKLGAFLMPSHPPERGIGAGHRWDLEALSAMDALGFEEAWIGEHFTAPWEPCPAPDLLIAQALQCTSRMKLAPGAHLLPYHHPVELAHRIAYLDHMAEGRYMLGIGISALPGDLALFDIDAAGGQNRRMTRESLEIMLELWTKGPITYDGEFWNVRPPSRPLEIHLTPFQKPHPPIGIAGLSPGSPTLELAGERGFLPLSIALNPAHAGSHWEAVERGAARAGRTADRGEWRLVRDICVAETDAAAYELARHGPMGRCWEEYLLPFYVANGFGQHFKRDPSEPDSVLSVDYLIENNWWVGSPDTVVEKIRAHQQENGEYGGILYCLYDHADDPEPWKESVGLLAKEVLPRL